MNFIRIAGTEISTLITFISINENRIRSISINDKLHSKMETSRNEFLWRKARKRASFKRHLQNYLIVNAGLWALYAITIIQPMSHHMFFPWPVWPMFGWGIGLVSHYFAAYGNTNQQRSTEIEYEKLIREQR